MDTGPAQTNWIRRVVTLPVCATAVVGLLFLTAIYVTPSSSLAEMGLLDPVERLMALLRMREDDSRCGGGITSDLQTVRSQTELYKIQHLDAYPDHGAGANCTGAQFVAQLTSRTNQAGEIMPPDGDVADYPFGPYLQQFPRNEFVSGPTASQVQVEAGTAGLGDGSHGWHFDTTTGQFRIDDPDHLGL